MKKFKKGDEVYILVKIQSIEKHAVFINLDGITLCIDNDNLDYLSDLQQTQFTDEELMFLIQLLKPHGKADLLVNNILDKINNLIQSPEEKQLLEMAEKFKDKYKIEKL
jgi:hypothetical protein